MTGREKILDCEDQVRQICAGTLAEFTCPWCGLITAPETGAMCCNEAARVVDVVLNYIDDMKGKEMAEKIMDRYLSMQEREQRMLLN